MEQLNCPNCDYVLYIAVKSATKMELDCQSAVVLYALFTTVELVVPAQNLICTISLVVPAENSLPTKIGVGAAAKSDQP